MDFVAALEAWREFYAAVANAAAALLGLVFVGTSLHLTLRRPRGPLNTLALSSSVVLVQPLIISLVMLIPAGVPAVQATGSLIMAAVGVAQLAVILRPPEARRELTRAWLAYRYGIPLAACIVLALGGLGMLGHLEISLFAPMVFVLAMEIVGIQDAWDLLTSPKR